jgi:hypothetical protein
LPTLQWFIPRNQQKPKWLLTQRGEENAAEGNYESPGLLDIAPVAESRE